jgi:copper chaperone CopZ
MRKSLSINLFLGLLMAVGLGGIGSASRPTLAAETLTTASSAGKTGSGNAPQQSSAVVIPIAGMTCLSCVGNIKSKISAIQGVQKVEVSLKDRHAKVTYLKGVTSPEAISKQISALGYEPSKWEEIRNR